MRSWRRKVDDSDKRKLLINLAHIIIAAPAWRESLLPSGLFSFHFKIICLHSRAARRTLISPLRDAARRTGGFDRRSFARPLVSRKVRVMYGPDPHHFDACLPRAAVSIRIASLHDAQVFARRWAIRDKDPALKALVRRLDRVRSGETAAGALGDLKSALASRGLLRQSPAA